MWWPRPQRSAISTAGRAACPIAATTSTSWPAGRASRRSPTLLQRGAAPDRAQLSDFAAELGAGRAIGALAAADLAGIARRQQPMEALRSLVSLASADDPDAASSDSAANQRKAARLTAQQPVLIAAYDAARSGRDLPVPDPGLGNRGQLPAAAVR